MLAKINNNAYKLDLPIEYGNVSTTFNVSNLSLFDVGEDSRTNPFKERGNDENMELQELTSATSASSSSNKDPLYIHRGLITKAKAKKMKEALTSLIEYIWRE